MNTADSGSVETALTGLNILVVEDDYLVASELASMLRDYGAQVIGPVPDSARARRAVLDDSPDCVLLDVNLKGQLTFDLAKEVREQGVPLIFTTGYDTSFIPDALRAVPCLQKPIEVHDLVERVRQQALLGV